MRTRQSCRLSGVLGLTFALAAQTLAAQTRGAVPAAPAPERVDLLTFARAAVLVSIDGAGFGETRPIATNNDESGRSLKRRVEVNNSRGEG